MIISVRSQLHKREKLSVRNVKERVATYVAGRSVENLSVREVVEGDDIFADSVSDDARHPGAVVRVCLRVAAGVL